MYRILASAVACAATLSFVPAYADAPVPRGDACGWTLTDESPTAPDGWWTGEVDGGPVVAADTAEPGRNPVSVTITCSIQVGGTGAHSDPDTVASSASGSPVAYLPPTAVRFHADPLTERVWYCTAWTVSDGVDTTTYYYAWDEQRLVTDPAATCYGGTLEAHVPPAGTCLLAPELCALAVVQPRLPASAARPTGPGAARAP